MGNTNVDNGIERYNFTCNCDRCCKNDVGEVMCELLSSATADDVEAMVVACDPIRTAAVAAKKSGDLSAAVAGYKEILRMQSNLLASSIVIVLIPLRLCLLLSSPFPRAARLLAFTRVGKPHSLCMVPVCGGMCIPPTCILPGSCYMPCTDARARCISLDVGIALSRPRPIGA